MGIPIEIFFNIKTGLDNLHCLKINGTYDGAQRWLNCFQRFDLEIEDVKDVDNSVADTFS